MMRLSCRQLLPRHGQRMVFYGLLTWVLASMGSGCRHVQLPGDIVLGSSFVPANVHSREPLLPNTLRRVAVLPMTTASDQLELQAGVDALEPILWSELGKLRRFEVQPVTKSQVQSWTGRSSWRAQERLPANLLEKARSELGCDAILFAELTTYRAYPPLAVGWNLRLVDGGATPVLWAGEEIFDAGMPTVVNGARRYQQQQAADTRPLTDSMGILNAPRRFGQYTLHTLLDTMPGRP